MDSYVVIESWNPMDVYETVHRVPLPSRVLPPGTLFMPMGGGNEYSKSELDKELQHCLAQAAQLSDYNLPEYLFASSHKKTGLLPPVLLWGWVVDADKMYKVIEKHWPHLARRRRTPKLLPPAPRPQPSHSVETREKDLTVESVKVEGDDEEWEDEDEDEVVEDDFSDIGSDDDDSKYPYPDYANTLFNYEASEVIRERFGVPCDDLLAIRGLVDAQGKPHVGIAIGTNYRGVANETTEAEVRELFDIKEEARWFLDSRRWFWTRNPLWPLLSRKAKKV